MKIIKKLLTILGLAATFSLPAFSQQVNTQKLDSFFVALENNNKIMGSFAVEKNGQIIYTRTIGYSALNENKGIKATAETRYRIGSITKMFTATMIFQLLEENKILLTTTLDRFFPQIPHANKITIEMLLKHRSGLYDFVNDQTDTTWITKPQTPEIIIKVIADGPQKFSPDKKFTYSNSGYYLLARILEKITALTYNENLQKRICSKLNLQKTYSSSDNELKTDEANTFMFADNKWISKTDIYFPNVVGVGDILSSPSELIKFDDALLAGKLVSQKSVNQMKNFSNNNGYGMGFMKVPFYKRTGYGHAGATYGTYSIVAEFPEDSLTVSSIVNGQIFRYNDVVIGILSICFGDKFDIPTFIKEK